MLFDHLMQDDAWLKRYTELGAANLQPFRRAAGFEELHFLRRYAAKLGYEISLYGGEVAWDALPDLYTARLTGATSFRYSPADAFVDGKRVAPVGGVLQGVSVDLNFDSLASR